MQTIYASQLAPRPSVAYRRERWDTPDGDFVDVDWLSEKPSAPSGVQSAAGRYEPGSGSAPLVVLFHGLEGCSASSYAHALMARVREAGWRGAVAHFRGCSGEANRLPRAYHSGDSAELDWILRRFADEHGAPIYPVGVSLGGNVLLKWLGEHGNAARSVAARAAAVSAPVDLMAAGNALGRGFNLVYTRAFLATLKEKSLAKLVHHPQLYNAALVRAAHAACIRQRRDRAAARLSRH